jgi:hypothetical protein
VSVLSFNRTVAFFALSLATGDRRRNGRHRCEEGRSSRRTAAPLGVATGPCGVKGSATKRAARYLWRWRSPES